MSPVHFKRLRKRYRVGRGRCAYCGRQLTPKTATVDHILARSKGGSNRRINRTLACEPCNSRKGSRDLVEFMTTERPEATA